MTISLVFMVDFLVIINEAEKRGFFFFYASTVIGIIVDEFLN